MGRILRLGLSVVVLLVLAAPVSAANRATAACTGSMLTGTFKVIPGSAGAGNIVYRLRLSPDVPGQGEPVSARQCEPTAYRLRLSPSGGGAVVVRIRPPTPVCAHGSLQLTSFVRG